MHQLIVRDLRLRFAAALFLSFGLSGYSCGGDEDVLVADARIDGEDGASEGRTRDGRTPEREDERGDGRRDWPDEETHARACMEAERAFRTCMQRACEGQRPSSGCFERCEPIRRRLAEYCAPELPCDDAEANLRMCVDACLDEPGESDPERCRHACRERVGELLQRCRPEPRCDLGTCGHLRAAGEQCADRAFDACAQRSLRSCRARVAARCDDDPASCRGDARDDLLNRCRQGLQRTCRQAASDRCGSIFDAAEQLCERRERPDRERPDRERPDRDRGDGRPGRGD